MSARERLLAFVKENEPSYGSNGFHDPETGFALYEEGEPERHVNSLLDAYRAEVLREAARTIRRTSLPDDYVDMFDNGTEWSADLIDPDAP